MKRLFIFTLLLLLLSSFATATDFTVDNTLWLLANSTTSENYGVTGSFDVNNNSYTEFDGITSYINANDVLFLDDDFTLEFNMTTTETNADDYVLQKGDSGASGKWLGCVLPAAAPGKITCYLDDGSTAKSVSSTSDIDTGADTKVTISRTGTLLELFINDVSEDTETVADVSYDDANDLYIGKHRTTAAREYKGQMSNFIIKDETDTIIYQNDMSSFSDKSQTVGDNEPLNGLVTGDGYFETDDTNELRTGLLSSDFGNGDYSVIFWIKPVETTSFQELFNDWSTSRSLTTRINSNGIQHYVGDGSSTLTGNNDLSFTETASFSMIVATHKASTNTLTLSINAGTRDIDTYTGTKGVSTNKFMFASNPSLSDRYVGQFQGIQLFNRVITESEESELYALGKDYNPYAEEAPTIINESVERTITNTQGSPIFVNSPNFITIVSATLNNTAGDLPAYLSVSTTIQSATDSVAECRMSFNGNTGNSTRQRDNTAGTTGSLFLTSENITLPNGTVNFIFECRRIGGAAFTVSQSIGVGHIQIDEHGEQIPNKFVSFINSTSSSSFQKVHTYNFTTRNDTAYDNILVIDWSSSYTNNAAAEELNVYFNVSGEKVCSQMPRYTNNGDTVSVSGTCIINLTASTTYDIDVYAKGLNAEFDLKVHNKNFILHSDEYLEYDFSIGQTVNNTNYTLLTNISIDNLFHDVSNLFVKASLPIKSNGTGELNYYFRLVDGFYDEVSPTITRSVTDNYGASNTHNVYELVPKDNYYLQLYARCDTGNCSFGGGSVIAHLTDAVSVFANDINITLKDWFNITDIQNFSVTIAGATLTTTDFSIIAPVTGTLVDINVSSDTFYNRTYVNHLTTNDLQANLYNSIVVLDFEHLLSREELNNVTITSQYYNGTYDSGDTLFFTIGNFTLNASLIGYGNNSNIILTTALSNNTELFRLSPALNTNLFDEASLLAFDINSPTSLTLITVCVNDSGTFESNISSNNFSLVPVCEFDKLKFYIVYDDEFYFRTIPNIGQFDTTNFDLSVWLMDLNVSTAVLTLFTGFDFFATYEDLQIIVSKNIEGEEYIITGDYVDIEAKLSAYLLQGQEYIVSILSSNQPDRILGNYFADISRDSTIRLFDLTLESETDLYQAEVQAYTYMTNESNVIRIRSAVNDTTLDNIAGSQFEVRENNALGTLLFSGSSSSSSAFYSYILSDPAFADNIYWTGLTVYGLDGVDKLYEKVLKGSELIPFPFEYENQEYQQWTFFILLLVLTFTATITTSSSIFLMVTGLTAFLRLIGWIELGFDSTIGLILLGVLGLISVVQLLREGDKS